MKLLEVKAEKRITAQEAIDHEFLNPNAHKKTEDTSDSLTMSWKK